jgi:hypothetical protein
MTRTIELYDMLKSKLGEKESKLLIEVIEEITEKAKAETATKEDLVKLEIRLIKWVLGTGIGVITSLYVLLKGVKF